MAFCISLHAQSSQSGTDRVTFGGSIIKIAIEVPQTAASISPTVVRSELTQAEFQATLAFSVALKMRNFAELQARIGQVKNISLVVMTARYDPTKADYTVVADWLILQGFVVKQADNCKRSVFVSGSVAQ